MIYIKLDCGIEVKIHGFAFGYTYGGLMEGFPNERMNMDIFERISYPSNWGIRKVLKIHPGKDEFEKVLKPTHYSVWLNSSESIDPGNDGSELVVIWLDELPNERTIEKIIETGIKHIDWNENAEDFLY